MRPFCTRARALRGRRRAARTMWMCGARRAVQAGARARAVGLLLAWQGGVAYWCRSASRSPVGTTLTRTSSTSEGSLGVSAARVRKLRRERFPVWISGTRNVSCRRQGKPVFDVDTEPWLFDGEFRGLLRPRCPHRFTHVGGRTPCQPRRSPQARGCAPPRSPPCMCLQTSSQSPQSSRVLHHARRRKRQSAACGRRPGHGTRHHSDPLSRCSPQRRICSAREYRTANPLTWTDTQECFINAL